MRLKRVGIDACVSEDALRIMRWAAVGTELSDIAARLPFPLTKARFREVLEELRSADLIADDGREIIESDRAIQRSALARGLAHDAIVDRLGSRADAVGPYTPWGAVLIELGLGRRTEAEVVVTREVERHASQETARAATATLEVAFDTGAAAFSRIRKRLRAGYPDLARRAFSEMRSEMLIWVRRSDGEEFLLFDSEAISRGL